MNNALNFDGAMKETIEKGIISMNAMNANDKRKTARYQGSEEKKTCTETQREENFKRKSID